MLFPQNIEYCIPVVLGAIYIARDDVLYYSNMSTIDSWERTVHCLFCNSMATLKPTKTRRIMLRCNVCGVLVFANGIYSQQRIQTLKDYRFSPIRRWLVIHLPTSNAFMLDGTKLQVDVNPASTMSSPWSNERLPSVLLFYCCISYSTCFYLEILNSRITVIRKRCLVCNCQTINILNWQRHQLSNITYSISKHHEIEI